MNELHPDPGQIVLLLEGRLAPAEREPLVPHVAACPACTAVVKETQEGLELLRGMAPRSLVPPPLPPLPAATPSRGTAWISRRRLWPAAAAVLLASASAFFFLRRPNPVVPLPGAGPDLAEVAWIKGPGGDLKKGDRIGSARELASGPSREFGIRFKSGVVVAWNRDTVARVESPSEIALTRGEVHVRVPPEGRGFAVATPQGRLVDLGTAFLARVEKGVTTATVLKGRVHASAGGASRDLGAGERAVLGGGLKVETVEPAEADRALAWVREAVFPGDFESVPVTELLDLLESVSGFRFDVDREKARETKVTASFGSASSEAVVEGLLRALGWKSEREGWTVKLKIPDG